MADYRGREYAYRELSPAQRAAKVKRQQAYYERNREALRAKARKGTAAVPKTQWSHLRIGERRRVLIEQAIARGWDKYRICNDLDVAEADYLAVRARMDEAVAVPA